MSNQFLAHNSQMTADELNALLDQLIAGWENEVVEFKEATDGFSTSDIGKYFSALSNEANLKGANSAWLVFGVNNDTRSVVGTSYRRERERLESLKQAIAQGSGSSLRNIYELDHPNGRVIFFEIPPTPRGIPTSWNGHYYGRESEHLGALSDAKRDEIRSQTTLTDWSAAVVPGATLAHLDEAAIERARQGFIERYPQLAETVPTWDNPTFLNKARITLDGQITRTAILLLGKRESWHLLSPHPAELTWKLSQGEQAYEHFSIPLLTNR